MSNTGVSTIDATNVNLTYNLRLGRTLDPGSVGQVVVSGMLQWRGGQTLPPYLIR